MLRRLNEAMDYIDSHITEELDETKIEQITGTSIYHFRRLFSLLAGVTLGEYIRNRKLSNATFDLLHEGMSVTEVVFKYGYESVDGFSRAFKQWAGISPSEVNQEVNLKAFPKLSFQLTIQGGSDMDYRIEDKDAFKIVGVSKRVPLQFEDENQEIIKLAQSITEEQRVKMRSFANVEPFQVVNASYNFDENRMEEKGNLDHMIGVITTIDSDFKGFDVVEVPALTWAKFSCRGEFPKVMQETWGKIFSDWLPSSNYELVEAPEISFTKDLSDLDNVYSEIWVAVKKKDN